MIKPILIVLLITLSGVVGTSSLVSAMPNNYHIAEPVDSLKVMFPSIGQSWNEITLFINVCDARFNPNCEYGNRRGYMGYEPIYVEIFSIDHKTKDLRLVEFIDTKTTKSGYTAIPILLDEKYQSRTQYLVTVTTENDVKTGKFWTFTKTY